jgi:hypothetical protein
LKAIRVKATSRRKKELAEVETAHDDAKREMQAQYDEVAGKGKEKTA